MDDELSPELWNEAVAVDGFFFSDATLRDEGEKGGSGYAFAARSKMRNSNSRGR